LRERKEDIAVLVAFFAAEAADSLRKKPPEASPDLLTLLDNYRFPGNVRELRAMIVDAVARHKSGPVLAVKSFRKIVKKQVAAVPLGKKAAESAGAEDRFPTLKEAERLHIEDALRRAGGNQGTAAALLGISRPALNRRLSRMRED
jgi:DNA-binding NtrC family response regulator